VNRPRAEISRQIQDFFRTRDGKAAMLGNPIRLGKGVAGTNAGIVKRVAR
jgi:hypothetical protein